MAVEHFGVARFDMLDPNAGGWASVAGQEAYRITNIGSLDNRTIWWTNLDFPALYAANVHRLSHIKRTNYLHSWRRGDGQDDFCHSWGLVRRRYTEKAINEALSGMFDQCMRFTTQRYGIDLSQREVLAYDTLADELRARLIPTPDPPLGTEVDTAVADSHAYYNNCMTPRQPAGDYVDICFSRPAVAYAIEMTNTIIPTDQVEYLDSSKLPARGRRLEWVLNQETPVLARVTVSDVQPNYASLISFGNGSRPGTNRSWLTQPEILLLANFARVEIEAAYVFSAYRGLPDSCALPEGISDLQRIMPTTQVWATNHWVGLCRENPYRLEPTKFVDRRTSPRAAWLTSIDRHIMFGAALQFHQAGFTPTNYGAGNVIVRVPKYNYRDAYDVGTAIGLLAPTTVAEDIAVQEDLQDVG
ncbi:MAG: hypothetical protein ACREXR_11105 [Gammaproteobacteria bacterium]